MTVWPHLPVGIFSEFSIVFRLKKQKKNPASKQCDSYTRMLQMNPP